MYFFLNTGVLHMVGNKLTIIPSYVIKEKKQHNTYKIVFAWEVKKKKQIKWPTADVLLMNIYTIVVKINCYLL